MGRGRGRGRGGVRSTPHVGQVLDDYRYSNPTLTSFLLYDENEWVQDVHVCVNERMFASTDGGIMFMGIRRDGDMLTVRFALVRRHVHA